MTEEEKIEHVMLRWYDGDEEKLRTWLTKPWYMLEYYHTNGTNYSPEEAIEDGKAGEVLELIELCLR